MDNKIKIILTANTGVLVEYNGVKYLFDGIHKEKNHYFSILSDYTLKLMTEENSIFRNIDYIFFSHNHPDHFTPKYTELYLEHNNIKKIFLPLDCANKFESFKKYIELKNIKHKYLKLDTGKCFIQIFKSNSAITAFNCMHVGRDDFADIENYCFVLTVNNRNILFTSDADYVEEYFSKPLKGVSIDTVFVNPIFFNNPKGNSIIKNIIKPKNVIIYHIPFEKDDKINYRKMVKKDIEKNKDSNFKTYILCDEHQTLFI